MILSLENSPVETVDDTVVSIIGEKLTLEAFTSLSRKLAGYPFVKVVLDRGEKPGESATTIHFINNKHYPFHADYIATRILGITLDELERNLDDYNRSFYMANDRRFFLGILALHNQKGERFFSLETVEVDTMNADMLRYFYNTVKEWIDPKLPLLFKPANHLQESFIKEIDPTELPRVFNHELFSSARFIGLNAGVAKGRLRAFRNEADYRRALPGIEWFDIVVMFRVPDDIPRVSGIVNAHHTTPLSHTNVLASGWKIPNSIQLGVFEMIEKDALDGLWVEYTVDFSASQIGLRKIERPTELGQRPVWSVQRIKLEEPEISHTPILELDALRMSDRYKYGTKAANLGELRWVLEHGSERMLGFYRVKRPPRTNLLPYLAKQLGLPESADAPAIAKAAWSFLRLNIQIPRGIALPFSVQQDFLESSPRIQQAIGKLKMALEMGARDIDSHCLTLQSLIRSARLPERIRGVIDGEIANHLSGVSSFVVRSSSNAEDLEGFSAAGIYESLNHVTTAENIFQSIKEVWASLLSPRSVRLRQDVGISLDDCYMGVIVQEEIKADMGGVLVTTNPMSSGDFRNVYINVSPKSVISIVQGDEQPMQYLYNTVEGGGRTVSIGDSQNDLGTAQKDLLQKLAIAGRLLQSHFSPDYTFGAPVDIEWIANPEGLAILQLRPYSK